MKNLRAAWEKFEAIFQKMPDVPLAELTPEQLAELQLAVASMSELIERQINAIEPKSDVAILPPAINGDARNQAGADDDQ